MQCVSFWAGRMARARRRDEGEKRFTMIGSPDPAGAGAGRVRRAAAVIVGAVAIAAFANFAVVLVLGGYDTRVFNQPLKAHDLGLPLIIAVAALAGRWLLGVPANGVARSVRSVWPWGIVATAAGAVVFAVAALHQPVEAGAKQTIVVFALALCGFLFAWFAYGEGHPSAARLVVVAGFLSASWGLGQSLPSASSWSKTFRQPPKKYRPGQMVRAEGAGLLLAEGRGVTVAKLPVANDWRDCMAMQSPGECSAAVEMPANATLAFSVASRRGAGQSGITVAFSPDRSADVPSRVSGVWEGKSSSIPSDKWLDVSVPLTVSGKGRLIYTVDGDSGADSILVANPRIEAAFEQRPNFILVVVDALRADRLGVYGYKRPASPEIDSLASQAVVFDNCVAQAPWTVPSLASIFTSVSPTAHGAQVYNSTENDSLDTFTRMLRREGYYTGAVQTNPLLEPEMGLGQGFNEYNYLGAAGWKGADKSDMSSGAIVTGEAEKWLAKHGKRPFFLYLHYMDIHRPFAKIPGLDRFGEGDSDRYDAEITYISAQFARLMQGLGSAGLRDNTMVIFTADHGEQFMERGRDGHASDLHIEELHPPLIIWLPGIAKLPGLHVKSLVRSIDIAPTILEYARAKPLKACEGESLSAALAGAQIPDRIAWSELTTQRPYGEFAVALTTGKYRFIFWNPDIHFANRIEVYNLESDKAEILNLAATHPELVAQIKKEAADYLTAERALHKNLVSEDVSITLTPERLEQLKALGYIAPSK